MAITERSRGKVKEQLGAYEEPKFDSVTGEAFLDYIIRREREVPDGDALNNEF